MKHFYCNIRGERQQFTWGPVVNVHEIGDISIVEYRDQIMDGCIGTGKYYSDGDHNRFHPYIDGKDTNCSCETLDEALIVALSHKYGERDAARYICKMLGMHY